MPRTLRCTLLAVLALLLPAVWTAATASELSTAPPNPAKKFRIAYYEGGTHIEYRATLEALALGLMDLGWIEKAELPERNRIEPAETSSLWRWLVQHNGKYLEFLNNGYLSGQWDSATRRSAKNYLTDRLAHAGDVDMLLAMGTWAGQDMATADHHIPTMVLASTDPVAAGAIASADDSGLDHVTAWVDPGRFQRQLETFHDLFGFQRLGIAYEDSTTGRSYAALNVVRETAKKLGFEVIECHATAHVMDEREAMDNLVDCHKQLAPQIDALYLTVHMGLTLENMPRLMAPLYEHSVPVFSQYNAGEVRHGAQVSLSKDAFREVGAFNARTMAMILNGAKPRDLPQRFAAPEKIAINLEAAEKIGWYPTFDIITAADELIEHTTTHPRAIPVE